MAFDTTDSITAPRRAQRAHIVGDYPCRSAGERARGARPSQAWPAQCSGQPCDPLVGRPTAVLCCRRFPGALQAPCASLSPGHPACRGQPPLKGRGAGFATNWAAVSAVSVPVTSRRACAGGTREVCAAHAHEKRKTANENPPEGTRTRKHPLQASFVVRPKPTGPLPRGGQTAGPDAQCSPTFEEGTSPDETFPSDHGGTTLPPNVPGTSPPTSRRSSPGVCSR